ncbi:hypothetical protein PHYPSEUDO_015322 [Phytophthora pseudosyringae]|uniref:Uncharacterized protein n=1 Tax=Phytophthora pseudosyringae TaxID=221518 RepID=A0A8T1W0I7_9STRA|nr:hypothetical protein PHYPSEUDO_015322 [Phytophthora pseudosyringae]
MATCNVWDRSGVADPFWKRVSNRLLEQRQRSAKENARLQSLVREQTTTFKALQHSLEKTPALSVSALPSLAKGCIPRSRGESNGSSSIKGALPESISQLVNLVQHWSGHHDFATNGPSPSLDGTKKVNIEIETDNNDGLEMSLQVVENKLVPFSFEIIREKAWEILTGTSGHEDFELTIQNQGDDMFDWCKLDNATGPMQMLGNVAVLQYVEADKLTII